MRLEPSRRALVGQNHITEPILQHPTLDVGMDRQRLTAAIGHDAGRGGIVQAAGIQQVERRDVIADAGMLGRRGGRTAQRRGGLGLGRAGRAEQVGQAEGFLRGGGAGVVIGAAVAAHKETAGCRAFGNTGRSSSRRGGNGRRCRSGRLQLPSAGLEMSEGIRHREGGQDRHAGALEPVHDSSVCVGRPPRLEVISASSGWALAFRWNDATDTRSMEVRDGPGCLVGG